MNLAETSDLLAFIARCDNRRADDATAIAWHSILDDLPYVDCLAAARQHFGTSTDYLMPVHIRRGAQELHRDRCRREREAGEYAAHRELEADPTRRNRSEATRQLIAELRDSLPEGDPDQLRRPEWLALERQRDRHVRAVPNPLYDPHIAAQEAAS